MPRPTFFNLPEEKRERIIGIALDEFAARAYGEASLSRIVERAGLAKGSMYQYFENKLDLYAYLIRLAAEAKGRYLAEAFAALGPGAGLFDQLKAAIEASVRLAREEPKLLAVSGNLVLEKDRALVERVMAQFGPAAEDAIAAMVAEAQRKGEVDPAVRPAAAHYLLSRVSWQVAGDIASGRLALDDVPGFMDELLDILEHGLRPGLRKGNGGRGPAP